MKKFFKAVSIKTLTPGLLYLSLLISPLYLFANKIAYNHCTVFPDDKIDSYLKIVIDNAIKRISKTRALHVLPFISRLPA